MKFFRLFIPITSIVFFLTFALQNLQSVDVSFLVWSVDNVPLFVVLITIFTLAFLLGRITAWMASLTKDSKNEK